MCLAKPGLVKRLMGSQRALVSIDGINREIAIHHMPDIKIGEYVLVSLGAAVERISDEEANEILALHAEFAEAARESIEMSRLGANDE